MKPKRDILKYNVKRPELSMAFHKIGSTSLPKPSRFEVETIECSMQAEQFLLNHHPYPENISSTTIFPTKQIMHTQ